MAIKALLEFNFKPDMLDEARVIVHRVLTETRGFDGCLGVDVLVDETDPARWVAYETWESQEHDAKYREFRAGPGQITDLPPLLTGAPILTKYTVADDV